MQFLGQSMQFLDSKEDTRACDFWILKKIPEHPVFGY